MKISTLISIALVASLQISSYAQGQLGNPLKARKQFIMPTSLTKKDYTPNTIVFKVKPEYRNIAGSTKIENVLFNQVLAYVGLNSLNKIFPKHVAPEKKYNELGQAYADLSLIYELKYTNNIPVEDAVNQVLASGIMEFAEPHYIYQLHNFTPNDPSITNAGQSGFLTRIRAYAAWDLALGGSQGNANIVIGIVDSGTDVDHPDLITQFKHNTADPINGVDDDADGYIDNYTGYDLAGADYINVVGDNDPNIMGANNDHGSHVSGCAAAATNNGIGVAGIGFNCTLLPVKCAADNDTRGAGGAGYIIKGYEGITYAADHGAKIINCSWGGPGGGSFGQTIVDYATINKNCLVVSSAGNSNIDEASFPASFNYVLSVAATNSTNDYKATFSTYNYAVDISTPGNGIYETIWNNSYGNLSGTSMSSPITAGGAGLVQSKFNYTNALQIGQRLKQTSDNHYTSGPNITGTGNTGSAYANKLGKGRMNLQRALTDPTSPSVVFANDKELDHNDNVMVVGDTIFITGDFINYLSPTTNLVASITPVVGGTYVSAVNTTASLGVINTLATKNNNLTPFSYKILAGTPQNSTLTFKVTLTDGTYTDSYFINVIVNVDYINIAINDVATSITSKGKIGYNVDGQLQGLGFSYLGTNLLYEAGLMVGTSSTVVSDCVRGGTVTPDQDFQSMVVVSKAIPSVKSNFDAHGRFNDALATPVQNLIVNHSAYAWTSVGNRKYVIVEYVIKNNGTAALNTLYAGIFADWDIDATTSGANKTNYDAATKMGYAYSTATGGKFAGIKLLTNNAPPVFYGIDNVAGGGGGVDVNDAGNLYSKADKYLTLSTNRYLAGTTGTTTTGTDILAVMSTGPFNISVGDSVKVAFALIAGDDLNDIKASADSAQTHYTPPVPTNITNNTSGEMNVSVFPNPANTDLSFVINTIKSENIDITLVNTLGQTVKHIIKNNVNIGYNQINADVSQLPVGTYYYQIKTDSSSVKGKVIITK